MKNKIREYIASHRDEIVKELCELVKIPSVMSEPTSECQYGEGCASVLKHVDALYKENGMETELDTNGAYHLAYLGNGDKSIGLFAHADVVAVDDKWTLCNPFEPKEIDGFLFGRGTNDDKCGVIISLYCAKMIRELEIPFNSRLVCFTGANEENGMNDIKNYVKAHTPPDFSMILDSGFPFGVGNKGILWLSTLTDYAFEDIEDAYGGESINIILGSVRLTLRYSESLLLELSDKEGISATLENGKIMLEAHGVSTHGALPEGSKNAMLVAIDALCACKSFSENDKAQLGFVRDLLREYYGQALGIESEDAPFGRLTFTNGMVRMENGRLRLYFDTRFGCELDALREKVVSGLKAHSMSFELVKQESAYVVSDEEPHIKACLKAYKDYTSNEEATPFVNAGSTYLRYLPCSIETGCSLNGGWLDIVPRGHGACHQPDEFISIDGFLRALELVMHMLIACDEQNK